MSVTPEPVGTEPVVEAAGDGGETQPTPATDGDVQAKYEALLGRLTALETGKQAAEAERDSLLDRINERLEPTTLHQAQPDAGAQDIAAFEQQLAYTATNSTDPNEKRAAAWMLGLAAYVRGMPSQFSEQMAMAPLDVATREQVKAEMANAAKQGVRITPDYARDVVNLRAQQAELTKLRAMPPAPPPNTRVVPSPVSAGTGGQVTYAQMNAEWATATPARKDELRQLEKAGKVVPG